MKKSQSSHKLPFFARFLESDDQQYNNITGGAKARPLPIDLTKKAPSDSDEGGLGVNTDINRLIPLISLLTEKAPSDSDEG
ncbi:MAG: microviridin/marinostatin family tricyclic proteinase inhibitor [Proteobacteria bacterium]|nr:microviridin/marinostatin family tricyclic proteinase inhibitor [Pseudomonadota bacterium]